MVFFPSGKRLSIRAQRPCTKCGASTWHICYGVRYEKSEPTGDFYQKHLFWSCEICGETSEETKQFQEPTERLMLINRLLKVGEDYDLKSFNIQSHANKVTLTVEFPDYDPARLTRLACRLEKGFINAGELMELHQAGFRSREDRERHLIHRPSWPR